MNQLNALLLELAKYGQPSIFCTQDKKWSCRVDFSFEIPGLSTTIKSGYHYDSPLAAAEAVKEKLIALAGISAEFKSLKELSN